ncbi:MAG: AAA family ATPase [Planctomycetes bacterium]|nr:AAA family ATPase [Planctomycetota bacterium]
MTSESLPESVSSQELLAALSQPGFYPHPVPGGVEVIQTHISLVFLAGARVYKVKKALDLGFLDYSTLERRRACCEAEVTLNRRLAPEVYLEVAAITREPAGGLALAGAGEVVDYAVVMLRLPAERTFKALVARGELTAEHVQQLAALLARFHRGAARSARIAAFGGFEVVAANCRENFTQLEPFLDDTIHPSVHRRLRALTEAELEAQRAALAERERQQAPCDCHGDLRLEHVYALEHEGRSRLVAVDCIEFNERFRYGDPVGDLAFPVMELMRAGREDLARLLAEGYFAASEDEGRALLPLYVAYRAVVRGKVRSFMAAQSGVEPQARRAAQDRARGHFLFALGLLGRVELRPCLALVGGLPASGKSTLARGLHAHGFVWVRADAVRKELAGLEASESASADFGAGLYTPAWSERTYAACLERAREALFAGRRVVVDASFSRAADRARFLEASRRWGVAPRLLLCEAPPEAVRSRMARRAQEPGPSDADWRVYEGMAARWEPLTPDVERITTRLDTRLAPEATLEAALAALAAR